MASGIPVQEEKSPPGESLPHFWCKSYDPGVPHSLRPYPRKTLLDIVSETAQARPAHAAFHFKGARISYARFRRESDAFAAGLVNMGVKPGDRVALVMPNCPQFFVAQFGAWRAGAIVSPINPLYTERELKHALNYIRAQTAIVLTPFYEKISALRRDTPLQRIIATPIKTYLPPPLRLLFTMFREKKEGHRITLQAGDVWMQPLIDAHADAPAPDVAVGCDDVALLLFTGGTTGLPKAAAIAHQALVTAGMQFKAWFGEMLVDWEDVTMALMPLFHAYGQVGVAATGFVGRNPLELVPNPRDIDDVLATIRKERPAFMPAVPTFFIALLQHRKVQQGKVDLSSLKLCISGAAPLMSETKQRFEALTGGRIIEGYALTESAMAGALTPVRGAYKPGAVGPPLPDVEIRIADIAGGRESLPPGEIGEVLLRAPQLMLQYWEQPEETARTIRDGWLYTGDTGYLDEDGYLHIVDRKKDLIKPGGFQVWPREVEEVIAEHPAVAEVGVAGVPDEYQGEAVKAWVVLLEGRTLTAEDLRSWCRQRLAGYKVPKHVAFCRDLPKSSVGKVLRRELRRREAVKGREGDDHSPPS